jgi:hypothetical protein
METESQPNYKFIEDPIFDITQHSIGINQDVINKSCNKYVGSNCSNSAGLNGSRSTITITGDQISKMQLQNFALEMQILIATAGTPFTKAVNVAPSWNLPFHCIRSINVKFNDSYTFSIPSDYAYVATANLLQYPKEYVNNLDHMLFTPCFDEDNDKYISSLIAVEKAVTNHASSSFIKRLNKYVNGYDGSETAANFSSHLHPYRKIIPFNHLLFNIGNTVINNLSKIQIDIDWESTSNIILERATQNVGLTDDDASGNVYVTSCAIITDNLNMSPTQLTQELKQKRLFKSDNIAFLKPSIYVKDMSSDKTEVINNVKNLSHVVIMQFSANGSNTFDNGSTTAANVRTYTSCGQTFLLSNSGYYATPETSTLPSVTDAALGLPDFRYARNFISGFQMQYGNSLYPNHTLTITDGSSRSHFDSSELYYEYMKCYDYIGGGGTPFISKNIFDKVFPFICIKPFSGSSPFQTSPSSDLIIRMNGGGSSGKYAIIVYTLETLKVNADKSITPFGVPN